MTAQPGLCRTWSGNPEDRFSHDEAQTIFVGFGTVFMGLEGAAKTLGRNLANETVSVVSHK